MHLATGLELWSFVPHNACYWMKRFQSDLINWFKGFGPLKKFINSLNDTSTKKEEGTKSLEDIK